MTPTAAKRLARCATCRHAEADHWAPGAACRATLSCHCDGFAHDDVTA